MSNICSVRLIEAVNNDSIINKDIENLVTPLIEKVKTTNKDSIINNDIENLVNPYIQQVGDQISGYEDRVGDQFARYGQHTANFWNDLL